MKSVFKCDHCNFTDEKMVTTMDHENTCGHNPMNRRCDSCKYSIYSPFSGNHECTIAAHNDNKKCDEWEHLHL